MQEIIELESKKMEVLKEISNINVLISAGQATLNKLKADEEQYIWSREKTMEDRVQVLLDGSKELLNEVKSNFDQIHAFYEVAAGFSASLTKIYDAFDAYRADFDAKSAISEAKLAEQEKDLSEQRSALKRQSESIDRDKKFLEDRAKDLNKREGHIESRQKQMKLALEIIKSENDRK